MKSQFQSFEPTTQAATVAATSFIDRMTAWGQQRKFAEAELLASCASRVRVNGTGAKAVGFISKDAMNMSVFGVVFDKNPGAGFRSAPGAVSSDAFKSGAKALVYIPDVTTAAGNEIVGIMRRMSAISEERPLLKVPGIDSVSVIGGSLSLAGAVQTPDGVRIVANPSAVKPTAAVRLASEGFAPMAPTSGVDLKLTGSNAPKPEAKFDRPSPYSS